MTDDDEELKCFAVSSGDFKDVADRYSNLGLAVGLRAKLDESQRVIVLSVSQPRDDTVSRVNFALSPPAANRLARDLRKAVKDHLRA